jgi:branched-chain amino acid transport system permease protein
MGWRAPMPPPSARGAKRRGIQRHSSHDEPIFASLANDARSGEAAIQKSALMDFFLQLLFTGIGIGAVYALVALGFVLIFRATSVVNFAQGEFSMVAAYLMVVFAVDLGWPYWLAFLISIAGMALLGAVFNLLVYYPLRNRTYLPVLISTIGASIFLSNSVLALYGPQPQVLPGWLDTPGFQLGPVYLDSQYLIIIGAALGLVAFQCWLFEHTLLGKKLQATSQDKEMATLLGIPVAGMIMFTFVYSAVLGGIAGILVAPVLFVSIQMGATIALKAFAATIIGGFGDVAGAILGGFAIGVIETLGAAYISVPFKDAFAFLVLILFLAVRPQGIFGERVAEKARPQCAVPRSDGSPTRWSPPGSWRSPRTSRPTAMSPTF